MRIPSPSSCFGQSFRISSSDIAWAILSPLLAIYLRDFEVLSDERLKASIIYWLTTALFTVLGFFIFRIHCGMARYFSVHDMIEVVKTVVFVEFATCLVLFSVTRLDGIPRSIPLVHGLLLATGLIAMRVIARFLFQEEFKSLGYRLQRNRIIMIGANRLAALYFELLSNYPGCAQCIIGVLDDSPETVGRAIGGVKILGTPQQLERVVREFAIHGVIVERVVVAGEEDFLDPTIMREVRRSCQANQIELSFLPRMIGITDSRRPASTTVPSFEGEPSALSFTLPPFFWFKRGLDIIGSLISMILLAPLFIITSLLVLVDVGSPILFWQQRVGRHGHPFLIYKFRTLKLPFTANGSPVPEDERLSAIGRILRASRADELPQLLNVLIGDMSLIGPRPLLPNDQPLNPAFRLLVRPGITGWAQVNGGKLATPEEKQSLDEWYIHNASLWTDLRIVIMTVRYLLRNRASSTELKADVEQLKNRNTAVRSTFAAS